ncbi:MAG: inorganic phosphate transporter [bacterium]|nr:inorganic phosphate transporter [bacterium]
MLLTGLTLLGGLFLGWGIGGNNAGNMFGTAVGTNSVRYRTAIWLIAVFCVVGAYLEGWKLYAGYKFAQEMSMTQAVICTFSAAIVIIGQTAMGIPTSTSQTSVGGVMGIAIYSDGWAGADWLKLLGWLFCWVVLPVVSGLFSFLCVRFVGPLLNRCVRRLTVLNFIYKTGLVAFGCYGSYTLGANNVVVTTGPFFQAGLFGDPSLKRAAVLAAIVGGVSMALGALMYGRKVMRTIGKDITALDPFAALVAVLAHSVAMHFFTALHVPVSSSQAIVGAVAGVGFSKGTNMVNRKILLSILAGWFLSPVISALATVGVAWFFL